MNTRNEENKLIQSYILKKHKKLSTYQMAEKLGIPATRVAANKAYLKRIGKLINDVVGKTIETKISYLEKTRNGENTYSNHNGINKETARNKMANLIIGSGIGGLIPTLPNTDWVIEKKIHSAVEFGKIAFIGIENHKPTYLAMRSNLKKTGILAETHFGKFNDKIFGETEDTYGHLIMDYCGELHTISKEVEYAIINDLVVVNGTLSITFAKPMRGMTKQADKLRNLACINNTDERCISDRAVEAYFNKVTGWNYKLIEVFYYQDTYPMTLVLIKRIK